MAGAIMVLTVKLLELSIPPSEWKVCPRKKGQLVTRRFASSIHQFWPVICYVIFQVGNSIFKPLAVDTCYNNNLVVRFHGFFSTSKQIDTRCPGESSTLFLSKWKTCVSPTTNHETVQFSLNIVRLSTSPTWKTNESSTWTFFSPCMVYLPNKARGVLFLPKKEGRKKHHRLKNKWWASTQRQLNQLTTL